jgi:C-terminal processing protease CtpA/Prc
MAMGIRVLAAAVGLCLVAGGVVPSARSMDGTDLSRAREMLSTVKVAIRNYFFDPAFNGLDLEAHFRAAHDRMALAQSREHTYRIIADALAGLEDPHTYFIPPPLAAHYDPGWDFLLVGDVAFVSAVRPGSDAAAKGMKAGDRVLSVEGLAPSRQTVWSLRQPDHALNPRPVLKVLLHSPDTSPRELDILPTKTPRDWGTAGPHRRDGSLSGGGDDGARPADVIDLGSIRIWKLRTFELEPSRMDRLAREALEGASAVVLDLRGNGGGAVESLVELVRRFFRRDVHIANAKERRRLRPLVASGRQDAYGGALVVLVDSATASSAEIFARMVQIEQRGPVVGDLTAACVMQSRTRMASIPLIDAALTFGVSIAEADVVMRDGRSLQGVGVTPDFPVLPAGDDLARGRDPALAYALALLGGTLDSAAAGRLMPR